MAPMRKLKLPNTFVLLFSILALIALATWLVPGGKYDTHLVDGKQLVDPGSFRYVPSTPQGPVALMMSPIKGFVEATGTWRLVKANPRYWQRPLYD